MQFSNPTFISKENCGAVYHRSFLPFPAVYPFMEKQNYTRKYFGFVNEVIDFAKTQSIGDKGKYNVREVKLLCLFIIEYIKARVKKILRKSEMCSKIR